jgi:menaquinone-dependent protoporphyrinogen oxidase
MSDVLVVYATKHGSTERVARAVATAMQAAGAQVRIAPAVPFNESLTGWDLVIIGGALYSGRWHRDAHRFLKRHRAELGSMPVAVFGMGPRQDTEDAWHRSRDQLDRALGKRAWLKPVSVAVFGGVDPPRRHQPAPRDLRDWSAIGDWARTVLATAVPANA